MTFLLGRIYNIFVEASDDRLLEPLEAYKWYYKQEFEQNASAYFDALAEKSGVPLEENRKTASSYEEKKRKIGELDARISKGKGVRGFLIALIVIGAVLLVLGVVFLLNEGYLMGSLFLVGGAALIATAIGVIMGKINPVLKRTAEERAKRQAEADKLLRKAWEQMAPLNALFDDTATKQLIEQTVPLIRIDDNFNMRRYDHLCTKYGFGEPDDPERSTIGILTGEILGNPFVVDRELVHTMGSCTYSGSLLITWTTTYTDSEGNVHVQHHSQTLVATIVRPKPYYSEQTRLIYGNEAAPDLHFSRRAGHAERLSEGKREKAVRSGAKTIRKLQEKAMKDDDPTTNFTEMGNAEFDVLFGALDRDNEVQFRLLFTPLAQKNILALMTDTAGYGDDFSMRKSGCLNFVSSEHSAGWDMDTDYRRYFSYSADLAKKTFTDFNCRYFKSLFFDLAPLLSIPLYQQHKPHEYLYPESYYRNYTPYESEYLANLAGQRAFCHPETDTQTILKTEFLKKEGESDRIRVTAYSYRTEDRLDFVPTLGGDGHMHDVPVHWVKYIPVVNSGTAALKELGLSGRSFDEKVQEGPLKEALNSCGVTARGYGHGILCCATEDENTPFDDAFNGIKQ